MNRPAALSRQHALSWQARLAVDEQLGATALKASGRLRWLADDPDCPDAMRLAALMEECGEVARAVHDGDAEALPVELIQLAGVALAWAAALEPERK